MSAILFADQASAHGRLTQPMTRVGHTGYENDPIGFQSRSMTHFACRNAKNAAVTPAQYTAGDTITIEWDLTANHIGDASVYISYDGDLPMSEIYNMNFFKIANIPKARDFKKSLGLNYQITLPDWLPAGNAVLRWEWYALHVNPTIELYAQCADIVITAKNPVALAEIAKYPVVDSSGHTKTLPLFNEGRVIYRDGFDPNSPQWLTGPACARGYTENDCELTAVGTKGNIDPATGNLSGGDVVVPSPTAPPSDPVAPSPTDNVPSPTSPPTDPNSTPNPSGITQRFFLDTSSELNVRKTLAAIGGLLAQCAWESGGEAPWHACDENNWSGSATASCTQRADGIVYHELTGDGACPVSAAMQMTAVTHASWTIGPVECTPGTATEKCCWWGRGPIQTTGPYNYGKLNTDVLQKMGSEHDLCTNPEAICQNDELKFLGTFYFWTEEVEKDACFDQALNEYAQDFNNVDHSPSDGCKKYSEGIGSRINNGIWNGHAHGESGRQNQFAHLMSYLKDGHDNYDGAHPNTCCTGNDKIDRMLELGNVKAESDMEAHGIYTWDSFCETLRLFTDNPDACSTGNGDNSSTNDGTSPVTPPTQPPVDVVDPPTNPPVESPTNPPVDDGTCSHQVAGERCTTTGEAGIESCCAAGHYCHMYSVWWSSCTLGSGPPVTTAAPITPLPSDAPATTVAPAPVSTPASTPAPSDGSCDGVDVSNMNDGAECGGHGYAGSHCCAAGLSCYAETEWWSSCKPSCQAGFLCEQNPTLVGPTSNLGQCPNRLIGQKCNDDSWTSADNKGCCAGDLTCYRQDSGWSGCFKTQPASWGWSVDPDNE